MSWPSPFKSIECTQQQKKKLKNEAQDLSRHLCREDIQMANRHTKRCSSLILSREMQIKLQWDILVRMATVKEASNKCWRGCGEKGSPYPPHTLLVECKLVQPLWGTEWRCLQKLRLQPPCDPAVPLLGIYSKEMKTENRREICTPMFIEALFTTAKMQKQPKCLSTKEWIKIWYIKRNNPTQRRTNTWYHFYVGSKR